MDPATVTIGQARDLAQFKRQGFTALALLENDHVRVMLVALEPGQEIPSHRPAVDLVVAAADGVGELLVGDCLYPLRAGEVAVIPAAETRGIRAAACAGHRRHATA
jgi:quercetin dioxygenase-like cupin family protein